MKTYVVTLITTITRTYTIEAESKEKAIETAQAQVNDYDDETLEEEFDAVRNYRWETDIDEKDGVIRCPYCDGTNIKATDDGRYHCKDCDHLFDDEDIERENLRHQISPLLDGTSEEQPKEIFFNLPSAEEEAQGLSSLEIPAIDKVFELEGDGTMWYHLYGEREDNGKDTWRDIDELTIKDMRGLLDYLKNE